MEKMTKVDLNYPPEVVDGIVDRIAELEAAMRAIVNILERSQSDAIGMANSLRNIEAVALAILAQPGNGQTT